ncbi:uncharacterized protein LOC110255593 [Sus scrofa]|uniref:uncharacterized protein LOC110255593 n=1 Tax=Sus scrofa TaxID=9823 RepID=UPI000A2B09C5|nr:uncharacterized protein LOC110255593 [Sus scrofa]
MTYKWDHGFKVVGDFSSWPIISYLLGVLVQLLWSPDMAAIVDEVTLRMLASWFQCKEPAVVKLLLRAVEILAMHGNMGKQLRALQPYVLNCCYSEDSGIVAETFKMLKCLVEQLTWEHSSAFLIQLAFTLGPFLEEVRPPTPVSLLWPLSSKGAAGTVSKASGWRVMPVWGLHRVTWTESRGRWQEWRDALEPEHILWRGESELLRLMAFESYGALLAKVSRRVLVFPLRHQVFNLLILLVLHLEDVNVSVAQIARPALCHTATVLRWSKLKVIFAEKDTWTILRALLLGFAATGYKNEVAAGHVLCAQPLNVPPARPCVLSELGVQAHR